MWLLCCCCTVLLGDVFFFLEVCALLCRHAAMFICCSMDYADIRLQRIWTMRLFLPAYLLFTILSAMNTVTKRTTHDITHWFCKNKRKQKTNQLFGCAHVCLCNGSPAVTIACWHVQPLTSSITALDLRVESGITTRFGGGEWVIGPFRKKCLGNDPKWVE